jgi:hypothetical protein
VKRPALLASASVFAAIIAIVLLRPAGPPEPAPAEPVAAAAPGQRLPAPPATVGRAPHPQAPGPTRPSITLHGVIYRGSDRSQVLLSVAGQPEQTFALGDPVAAGWWVHAIRPEAVVLANGTELATIGVAAPAPSAVTAAMPAPQSSAPAAARRLPGFVAGPAPATDSAQAHERNRRFLDAVQGAR